MVDTVRTLAALQTLLADNTTQDISPQDIRDFLVSVFPNQYSGARINKGGTDQNNIASGSSVKVTFDTVVFDTDSYFDDANDQLEAPEAGLYLASGAVLLIGAADALQILPLIRVNGTTNTRIGGLRDPTTAFGYDQFGFAGSVPLVLAQGDAVDMAVNTVTEAGTDTVDISGVVSGTWLSLIRIGQTPV